MHKDPYSPVVVSNYQLPYKFVKFTVFQVLHFRV